MTTSSLARHGRLAAGGLLLWLLCLLPRPAAAQAQVGAYRPERPNRAVFQGGYGTAEQSVIATGALGVGAGRTVEVTGRGNGTDSMRATSTFGHALGSLDYNFDRERLAASAGIGGATHYTPSDGGRFTTATSAHSMLRVAVTRRTTIRGHATAALEPLSALSLLPGLDEGAGVSGALDYGLGFDANRLLRYQAEIGIEQTLTRRLAVEVGVYRSFAEYTAGSASESVGAVGRLRYQLTRHLSARVGYGRDAVRIDRGELAGLESADEPDSQFTGERIDASLDFQQNLSLSRRTTLALNTGTVMYSQDGRRHYDLTGTATLRREIGRTWYSSVGYTRDAVFVTTLGQPTFTDSVQATVAGLIGRRVNVNANAGASHGRLGIEDEDNGYVLYRAGTGMTLGLTRDLGVSLFYSFFNYRFDQTAELPDALRHRELSGHAFRVGIDLFLPIYHRARRP